LSTISRLRLLSGKERLLPDFPTKGVILKMEFLYPSQNDHGQIILLLIISKHRKSRMLWYEWNSGTTLRESQLKAEVRALPEDEQLPLLLIPLKLHSATFMIICEKRITLYRDILTGSPSRYVQHLEDVKDPEEPGSSGRQPIWVQWARPMRTPKHQRHIKFDDAIFLCREDGIVQYLELYNNLDHMLDSTHPAGRLGISMNTAFAILDLGPATVDLLAAGGDMSEGGLWRFGPRVDPTRVTTIPTWSPLSDFVAATIADKAPISVRSNATTEEVVGAPSRIFACTGRGKHGAISELRCGIEASRKPGYVDLGEEVKNSVLGIWAFHGYYGEARQQNDWSEPSKKDATYILMSHPTRTSLLRIQWVKDPGLGNRDLGLDYTARTELVTKDLGIDYNARTITSAATPYGMTIQVTENSIRTTTLLIPKAIKSEEMDDDEPEEIKPATGLQGRYIYRYESYRVLAACIHTFLDGNKDETLPNETYILLALQIDEAYHVQFGQLLEQFWPTATLTLSSQPSCLLLHRVCAYLLAFVATLDGRLHVFVADERREKLHMVCDFEFEGPFAICDSLTIITSNGKDETQSNYLVVCGLRDGLVVVLRLVGVPECL